MNVHFAIIITVVEEKFVLMNQSLSKEDEASGCSRCSHLICSQECEQESRHNVECSQLARLEGEHHRVVGLLRLLRLRENGGDIWEQIGLSKFNLCIANCTHFR